MALPLGLPNIRLDRKHFIDEPSIIVYKENQTYYALDTKSKAFKAQDPDAGRVISQALDAITSGKVAVKAGTYSMGSGLDLAKLAGKSLIAEGPESTILEFTMSSGSCFYGSPDVVIKNVELGGFTVKGNPNLDYGLNLLNVQRSRFRDIYVQAFTKTGAVGLRLAGASWWNRFEGIKVGVPNNDVYLPFKSETVGDQRPGQCWFYNCEFWAQDLIGGDLTDGLNLNFIGGEFHGKEATGGVGVKVRANVMALFEGVHVEMPGYTSYSIDSTARVQILGGYVDPIPEVPLYSVFICRDTQRGIGRFIPIAVGQVSTTSTIYTAVYWFTLNLNNTGKNAKLYVFCTVNCRMQLYNITDAVTEITNVAAGESAVFDLPPTGTKDYRIEIKSTDGSDAYLNGVTLLVY